MDMILKNTFQSISPAYELIGDVTVGSNTTQVDFTGLNIGKDDELLLVSDYKRISSGYGTLQIFCDQNGTLNTTSTNYWFQELSASATSVSAYRGNSSAISFTSVNNNNVLGIAKLKLTNSGHFVWQNTMVRDVASSSVILYDIYGTSTFTTNSITQLRFQVMNTTGIGTGSRFQLYKLVAEKVADIIVPSNTTSVDITGLNIGKDGEYYLVSDVYGTPAYDSSLQMLFNSSFTTTNYFSQDLDTSGTLKSGERWNNPAFAGNGVSARTFAATNIKVTNAGYLVRQSNVTQFYGGGSIELRKNYGTTTFMLTGITDIRVLCTLATGIGANSRFTLYKMK